MNDNLESFHKFQNIQVSSLTWGHEASCAGCLLNVDSTRMSCLSKACLETGCPVVLTVLVDKLPHELLGRVTECKPTQDGEFLVRLGMEYTDIETQGLLAKIA